MYWCVCVCVDNRQRALVYWSVAIVAFRLADRGRVCQAASQKDDEEEEVEDRGVTRDEVIQMLGV